MPQLIHRLALLAVAVVAGQSILLTLKPPFGSEYDRVIQPIVAVALWSFLIWKLRQKPRKWGLGIGVFLLAMLALQTHLWLRAIKDPSLLPEGFDPSVVVFILWELPLAIAAILCISLRWRSPTDTTAGVETTRNV